MQEFSLSTLLEMTVGLASGANNEERFHRLLDAVRKAVICDCVVLMSLHNDTLTPLAMQGLTRDTLGRRFVVSEHPRLAQICSADLPVRFAADCHSPTLLMGCYSTAKTICLCTHVWAYPSILASNYWVY